MVLSQHQADAITEILGAGVDQAATALVELVRDDVTVHVPSISVLEIAAVGSWIHAHSPGLVPSATLQFHGPIHGHLGLLFPMKSANLLASALGVEPTAAGLREVIEETGNLLLNAVAGSIANCLGYDLTFDTPRYGDAQGLIDEIASAHHLDSRAVLARTCFEMAGSTIEGQILLHLDRASTEALVSAIDAVHAQ